MAFGSIHRLPIRIAMLQLLEPANEATDLDRVDSFDAPNSSNSSVWMDTDTFLDLEHSEMVSFRSLVASMKSAEHEKAIIRGHNMAKTIR